MAEGINWEKSLKNATEAAKKEKKLILIDFTTPL